MNGLDADLTTDIIIKRSRKNFSQHQLYQLELVFRNNHYPDVLLRGNLAAKIGLPASREYRQMCFVLSHAVGQSALDTCCPPPILLTCSVSAGGIISLVEMLKVISILEAHLS